ncbi:MAG: hypothetical protein AAGH45_12445 [Pseudomonadota bacterium]
MGIKSSSIHALFGVLACVWATGTASANEDLTRERTAKAAQLFLDLCVKGHTDLERVETLANQFGFIPMPAEQRADYVRSWEKARGATGFQFLGFRIPGTEDRPTIDLSLNNAPTPDQPGGALTDCSMGFDGSATIAQIYLEEGPSSELINVSVVRRPDFAAGETIGQLTLVYRVIYGGTPLLILLSGPYEMERGLEPAGKLENARTGQVSMSLLAAGRDNPDLQTN